MTRTQEREMYMTIIIWLLKQATKKATVNQKMALYGQVMFWLA